MNDPRAVCLEPASLAFPVPLLKLVGVPQRRCHAYQGALLIVQPFERSAKLRLITLQRTWQAGKRIQVRQKQGNGLGIVSQGHGQFMQKAD